MQKQWLWNDLQNNGEVMPLCIGLVDCTECGVRQHIVYCQDAKTQFGDSIGKVHAGMMALLRPPGW
jgi:hypothetical protein